MPVGASGDQSAGDNSELRVLGGEQLHQPAPEGRPGAGPELEQELLAGLADLAIDLFAMESSLERAKLAAGSPSADTHADLARLDTATPVLVDDAGRVVGVHALIGIGGDGSLAILRRREYRLLFCGQAVSLLGDGIFSPRDFTLANPPRIVVDLPGVKNEVTRRVLPGTAWRRCQTRSEHWGASCAYGSVGVALSTVT